MFVFIHDDVFYNLAPSMDSVLKRVNAGECLVGYSSYRHAEFILSEIKLNVAQGKLLSFASSEELAILDQLEIVCPSDYLLLYKFLRDNNISIVEE